MLCEDADPPFGRGRVGGQGSPCRTSGRPGRNRGAHHRPAQRSRSRRRRRSATAECRPKRSRRSGGRRPPPRG